MPKNLVSLTDLVANMNAKRVDTLTQVAAVAAHHIATAEQVMNTDAETIRTLDNRVRELEAMLVEQREIVVRMQAERFAPQRVTTDAFGLRFHGPQGAGTGDRLKAVGGRFHFTSKKGEAIRGYWTLPTTDAARNLSLELSTEGKQVEPFAL